MPLWDSYENSSHADEEKQERTKSLQGHGRRGSRTVVMRRLDGEVFSFNLKKKKMEWEANSV